MRSLQRLIIMQIYFFICFYNIQAQSFSNSLPKTGDVQYNCEHNAKAELFMVDFENRENWDFNFLMSYWSIKEIYKEAKLSYNYKDFPDATLVLNKADNEEEFYTIKDGSLYSLGKILEVNYNVKGKEIIRYDPPKRVINTTKKIGQTYNSNYTIWMKFAKKDMLEGYNFVPENNDSLMIEIGVKEIASVTDEGNIIYNNASKKAQKHEINVSQTIKMKVKQINESNWQPYAKFNKSAIPEVLYSFIKYQKNQRIDYICSEYKGVLLSYELQDKNLRNFFYQDMEPSPYMKSINYNTFDIIASPNPTAGNVSIRVFNYPFDNYTIELYNVVGKKIYSKSFTKKSGRNLKMDISSLKRGTYMYSLIDGKGRKLMTKRISLIGI